MLSGYSSAQNIHFCFNTNRYTLLAAAGDMLLITAEAACLYVESEYTRRQMEKRLVVKCRQRKMVNAVTVGVNA